jgi:hypothetical protein
LREIGRRKGGWLEPRRDREEEGRRKRWRLEPRKKKRRGSEWATVLLAITRCTCSVREVQYGRVCLPFIQYGCA